MSAAGGSAPYTWSVQSGSPPAGLTLDANTGVISGTPTAAISPATFTIKVTDATSATATKQFQLTVAKGTTTTAITQIVPDTTTVGSSITVTVSVTGAGGTPTGQVTVDDGTGAASGCTILDISTSNTCSFTPNTLVTGAYTATATYQGDSNYNGSSGTKTYTLQ